MDFVSDGLMDGRRLRCLKIADDFIKEYWRLKSYLLAKPQSGEHSGAAGRKLGIAEIGDGGLGAGIRRQGARWNISLLERTCLSYLLKAMTIRFLPIGLAILCYRARGL
jgi:hypothetical protein